MAEFEKPEITWTQYGVPKSKRFNDFYFNEDGGLEESRFVFLQHNQLQRRWSNLKEQSSPPQVFSIAETGFGTGLNFLVAWQLWNKVAPNTATLHYIAVEKYPLHCPQITQAHNQWAELAPLAKQLVAQYPNPIENKVNRLSFNNGRVKLTLIFDSAEKALAELLPSYACAQQVRHHAYHYGSTLKTVDAWFLDGFSPSKNPDMWTPALYQIMAALSSNSTSISTFTSASDVRRGLQAVGFNVQRASGFGRKREMLAGTYVCSHPVSSRLTPSTTIVQARATRQRAQNKKTPATSWHLSAFNHSPKDIQHIAIIGAGLAGAHSAYALATRGFKVTVFEQSTIASGASGNPQGVVYTRFSHQNDALAQFNRYALHYADQLYSEGFYGRDGDRCGVLHLNQNEKQQAIQLKIAEHAKTNSTLATYLNRQQTIEATQLEGNNEGLFTQIGGWLQPAKVCQNLLKHPNISVKEHTFVKRVQPHDGGWQLELGSPEKTAKADLVIIANANSAALFEQTAQLPIKPIRGQMTYGEISNVDSFALTTCLCGDGYIAPPIKHTNTSGTVCFGATFDLNRQDLTITEEDNHKNLALAAQLITPNTLPSLQNLQGRASYRCTTRDYLPIVGPVCNHQKMLEAFAPYRANKYTTVDQPGRFYNNLFMNIGHGSRGLSYTPLAAEILASVITGEPLPIDEKLYQQIHPARFVIRDLIRNKA
ncbi:bifunctional tRNA (5-methylaminomethyl-2-thiouridine)(34)-methyltransferase MnmD/FAD-dependent 5-carboxymethylaminomethyl-2-thiouridine(34) oxidoreductase MnmC [Marinagarivorans cellulosilyticus]|uniref:tRNA 5-methylaminomethyl-2-thiouridine biosynthesis bifunctional protein MnmC n=1 Tax=Marinagarivorans cellulosilyticus TaxID=2721545 RepID=A0AAN1WJ20_9GAMM|nr:bifunctional tRNA (5-methylaminomethyl-2-thiouridine)(34)-methyltransferase MnmD/FAD-dependent 5-carboxymethylaminomethyl-2-thiouridine(34) oxidoreductase MnmC [Marinagarivorans cellulosilyticus]BCD98558.1 tRNA 5-methylaminomethyl-2-thiouridine biosynthesis bifunctional protein [Marinagarivorans cellulosilyticus]